MGSGSSVPCCNDRESYIRDEDRDSVTVSRRNFRHHDLEIVSRTNNLLNRWNQAEVISLKAVFQKHCHINVNSKASVLNESSFFRIFPRLKKCVIDDRSRHNVFCAFDLSDRKEKTVDFRDFCRCLAIACKGTRGELLCLLFDMCTGANTSLLVNQDLLETVYHCAIYQKSIPSDCSTAFDVIPSIQLSPPSLTRLLGLCGISSCPSREFKYVHYFTSYQEASSPLAESSDFEDFKSVPVDCGTFSSQRSLNFFEFIDFANAFISDSSLCSFQRLFDIIPGAHLEREELYSSLHHKRRVYSEPREVVYLLEERWWQQWCCYAGVKAMYDCSGYCVIDLEDSEKSSYPTGIFSPLSTSVNNHHSEVNNASQSKMPFVHRIPIFHEDIVERPREMTNLSLQDADDAYAVDKVLQKNYIEDVTHKKCLLVHDNECYDKRSLITHTGAEEDCVIHKTDTQNVNGLSTKEQAAMQTGPPTLLVRNNQTKNDDIVSSVERKFSIISKEMWMILTRNYRFGGSPTIPRLVSEYMCEKQTSSENQPRARPTVLVDIDPLVVQVCFCDKAGGIEPFPLPHEVLMSRQDSIDEIVVRLLSTYIYLQKERGSPVTDCDDLDDNPANYVAVENMLTNMYRHNIDTIPVNMSELVRVWILQYDSLLLEDDDEEEEEDGISNNIIKSAHHEDGSTTQQSEDSLKRNDSPGIIRHGPLSWWSLTEAFGQCRGSFCKQNTASESLRLSSEGSRNVEVSKCTNTLTNGSKIMIEARNVLGGWPTDRVIEHSEFRSCLSIGSKVDAQDETKRWYAAEVVDIKYDGGLVEELKVHYISYPSRYDAVYPASSCCLAPSGSHTTAMSTIPGFPIKWQDIIEVLTKPPNQGRKCCLDYSGDSLFISNTDKNKKEGMKSLNIGSGINEEFSVDGFVRVPRVINDGITEGTSNAKKRGIFAFFSNNGKQQELWEKNGGVLGGPPDRKIKSVLPEDSISTCHDSSERNVEAAAGSNTLTPSSSVSSVSSTPRKGNRHEDVATNTHDIMEATPKPAKSVTEILTTPAKSLVRNMFASVGISSSGKRRPNMSSTTVGIGRHGESVGRNSSHVLKQAAAARARAIAARVPGACGLLNIGNTCFMSCGIQCLSHTPLLRSYFLSGRYIDEINHNNVLGTNGRLVAEFAQLLKTLWTANSHLHSKQGSFKAIDHGNVAVTHYTSPSRFKRIVEKCKPIFCGHDQQDAQEFLSEILDTLHEDVNRVVDKPYITPPDDTVWDAMSIPAQAANAWGRHLARNSSVLADLFQGQMLSEVTCPECNKVSRTFDPFMSLSVPIPKYSEVTLCVYVVQKLPRLPRLHRKPIRHNSGSKSLANLDFSSLPSSLVKEYLKLCCSKRLVRRYAVKVPRLGTLPEVRKIIGSACGLPPTCITLAECVDGSMTKLFEDDKHTALNLKTFDSSCEKWILKKALGGGAVSKRIKQNMTFQPPPGSPMLLALETIKDVQTLSNLSSDSLSDRNPPLSSTRINKQVSCPQYVRGEIATREKVESSSGDIESILLNHIERIEFEEHGNDPREGDLLVDIAEEEFALSFEELKVGDRLDARDHKGQWFAGQVAFVVQSGPPRSCSSRVSRSGSLGSSEKWDKKVRVHFDKFTSKWDEIYTYTDFKNGKLAPIYSRSSRKLSIFEIFVVNRQLHPTSTQSRYEATSPEAQVPSLFGIPWIFHVESFRSCEHVYRHVVEQSLRYIDPDELIWLAKAGLFDHRSDDDNHYDSSKNASSFTARTTSASDEGWIRTELLPFSVRVLSMQDVEALPTDETLDLETKSIEGFLFPRDTLRPISNLYWNRLLISVDWEVPRQCPHQLPCSDDDFLSDLDISVHSYNKDYAYRDQVIFNHASHIAEATAFLQLVEKHRQSQRQSMQQQQPGYKRGSRSFGNRKSSLSASIEDLLQNTGIGDDVESNDSEAGDEEGSRLVMKWMKNQFGGLNLSDCLSAFTKEEKLEDESWYCSSCKKHQRGIFKQQLYRLPDILIIHIKRFNMTARFREKIKAKVTYPLQGLDMQPFKVKVQSSGSIDVDCLDRNEDIYDLYGVSNHLGGMSGGHYTAFIRPDSVSSDTGTSSDNSMTCSKLLSHSIRNDDTWLLFDDEYVEEVSPDKVVTDAAYVLFYKRRNLTSSNIINLAI